MEESQDKCSSEEVLVTFNGVAVAFRVLPNISFAHLKEDVCDVFNLRKHQFTLNDPSGGQIWPNSALVKDALDMLKKVEVEVVLRGEDVPFDNRFPKLNESITNMEASKNGVAKILSKAPISLSYFSGQRHSSTDTIKHGIKVAIHGQKSTKLCWPEGPPSIVLMVMKPGSDVVVKYADTVGKWLQSKSLIVCVEDEITKELPSFVSIERLKEKHNVKDPASFVDFIVTLGGDGTVLHTSSLFEFSVPPVLSFNLGSLGFLTRHQLPNFRSDISALIAGEMFVVLRARLCCRILTRDDKEADGWRTVAEHQVLNEIVIDKGGWSNLTNLDTYCDGVYVTTVQADGVIFCTPTGSTAYSLSCGGTMIHPSVPSIAFTPISPHSLSFRPVVFPARAELRVTNSKLARNTAFISFDGKHRTELQENDVVSITTSDYPLPSASASDDISSWFSSLAECLHWNDRKIQGTAIPESML